jgi:alpha-glucosidase
MLLLTLRGTPTMYYGDEIGMTDVPVPRHLVQDPFERNVPGLGCGRDPERSPMQWDAAPGGGFTAGVPWLPLAPDWRQVNVAAEANHPASILTLYRRLIALRRMEPALSVGAYLPLRTDGTVLAYFREVPGRRLLVVLNLDAQSAELAAPWGGSARLALTTYLDRDGVYLRGTIALRPDEGMILEIFR